jgi:hypothetical protein
MKSDKDVYAMLAATYILLTVSLVCSRKISNKDRIHVVLLIFVCALPSIYFIYRLIPDQVLWAWYISIVMLVWSICASFISLSI